MKKHVFLLLLLVSISILARQGKQSTFKYRYPFIKRASCFSTNPWISNLRFDYIIVGGGTAGCPLAATLSQKFNVLLLERGGVPFFNANVSYLKNFHISLADTSPTSASDVFISSDGVINSRARVLGGGTSINAGFYTRASARDIEEAGWDAKLVNESYPWIERQIVFKPKVTAWQNAVRNSLIEIGISPDNGFTYDHIPGTKIGGTIFDKNGFRHTAADLLSSANPEKLTVLIHATVQRITFHTTSKHPKARGVVFRDEKGNEHEALISSTKGSEVIVSCGAIGSPHLLQLSGIGPADDLEKLGIPIIVENKNVGQGMADNPHNSIFVPSNKSVEMSLIQTVGITKKGIYIEASSGFGQSSDSIRCHPWSTRSQHVGTREVFRGGFVLEKVANPRSRGELRLVSRNVEVGPRVRFNYFREREDLRTCVYGLRLVERVIRSRYFRGFIGIDGRGGRMEGLLNMSTRADFNLLPKHMNDTRSLEQFCRDTVITIWHYHGGCHVGKVVMSDYRVIGVRRLRVVDGSTFRTSPGTNPQGTVLMLGRYMGVKILRERGAKSK